MRVTLGTEEFQYQAGLFKRVPKWRVTCKIEFSADELQLIRSKGLGDTIVYTQSHHNQPGDDIKRTLDEVIKHGISCTFNTIADAKDFENLVETGTLPALKEYLDEYRAPLQEKKTFEL